jgi:hypothetical protein
MTSPAPVREIRMNIKIVKKGNFNPKAMMACPFLVDEDGLQDKKK